MELRVKTLKYNSKNQLEEYDLGPAPWGTGVPDGVFDYTFAGRTYTRCYVEFEPKLEQPTAWRLLGYAVVFLISVGSAFALSLVVNR